MKNIVRLSSSDTVAEFCWRGWNRWGETFELHGAASTDGGLLSWQKLNHIPPDVLHQQKWGFQMDLLRERLLIHYGRGVVLICPRWVVDDNSWTLTSQKMTFESQMSHAEFQLTEAIESEILP